MKIRVNPLDINIEKMRFVVKGSNADLIYNNFLIANIDRCILNVSLNH